MLKRNLPRCFPLRHNHSIGLADHANGQRIENWLKAATVSPIRFSDQQTDTMARLLPLLLCGEQSAQLVFNSEIARLAGSEHKLILSCLHGVEADEYRHDIALQQVASQLTELTSFSQVQRKAKRFYASLGRVENYSEHFVRIAILDTCVTHIMQSFEQCHLGREHPFSQLCGLIKKDEAKHVYVSRKHAMALGADANQFAEQHEQVVGNLMQLLLTQGGAFESIGVCLDGVTRKLEAKWR
ncbi:hypothetical protein [Shewanella kaireitica]|uniref:hypothetical protein n=1 Tax=Shewanella kaireitica TaxID=212021 RepID=UPI00200CDC09|nr:hypothetical protein [Shewanella kaireitica]MCL1092617.1 hypothetical protein [Shewanella kaireitica]